MSLKNTLSISLPITILLILIALLAKWDATIGGALLVLAFIQWIFWKFQK